MTAKQAITRRCADCFGRRCGEKDCALYGLRKAQAGADRVSAIQAYCRWCMNGNPVRLCASPDCAIYQYRAAARGALKIDFAPQKPRIDDEIRVPKSKPVILYPPAFGGPENAPYAGGAA